MSDPREIPPRVSASAERSDDPERTSPQPTSDPAYSTGYPAIPGYEILGELGRGGMGIVYKAREVGLDRLVALKVLLSGSFAGSGELVRFANEAKAIAQVNHPNVVQIFHVGSHEGRPFFTQELVEGGTLARALDGKPWEPKRAAARSEGQPGFLNANVGVFLVFPLVVAGFLRSMSWGFVVSIPLLSVVGLLRFRDWHQDTAERSLLESNVLQVVWIVWPLAVGCVGRIVARLRRGDVSGSILGSLLGLVFSTCAALGFVVSFPVHPGDRVQGEKAQPKRQNKGKLAAAEAQVEYQKSRLQEAQLRRAGAQKANQTVQGSIGRDDLAAAQAVEDEARALLKLAEAQRQVALDEYEGRGEQSKAKLAVAEAQIDVQKIRLKRAQAAHVAAKRAAMTSDAIRRYDLEQYQAAEDENRALLQAAESAKQIALDESAGRITRQKAKLADAEVQVEVQKIRLKKALADLGAATRTSREDKETIRRDELEKLRVNVDEASARLVAARGDRQIAMDEPDVPTERAEPLLRIPRWTREQEAYVVLVFLLMNSVGMFGGAYLGSSLCRVPRLRNHLAKPN